MKGASGVLTSERFHTRSHVQPIIQAMRRTRRWFITGGKETGYALYETGDGSGPPPGRVGPLVGYRQTRVMCPRMPERGDDRPLRALPGNRSGKGRPISAYCA